MSTSNLDAVSDISQIEAESLQDESLNAEDVKEEHGDNEDQISLLELLSRLRGRMTEMNDDEETDDEDDEDEDDEDDEDDEVDEDEDEDDDEDDDDDVESRSDVGKRVILRRDYKNNKAYCEAVLKSMQAVLRQHKIHATPHAIRDNVKVFAFDRTTHGVDVDCHILIEYDRCNYRIEFKFNEENQPGREPLIDHYCQEKNFPLRYGCVIMDHNDGEKKIEYSSCFRGAFAEEAFDHYWEALDCTLDVFAKEFVNIASSKKLDPEQRKLARKMIGELSANLSKRIKPENEERFSRAVEILGGNLSLRNKRLLNYIVEHSG